MKEIKNLLLNLGGVKTVSGIAKQDRGKIGELERDYERSGVVGLNNKTCRTL